ncbi:MAG: FG-GAP repeat domain-containing protein [Candidatus Rokuibacteriota bacterium]
MRHGIVIGAVGLIVGLGGVITARADLLQDLGATFERVAQDLERAFPKADTRVMAVEGEQVRLEGPGTPSLRPGLELVVYRKGQQFRHPITNQPLGHAEDDVATAVVTAVEADHAMARVASGGGGLGPLVGDGARLTAGRIPVAVLPTRGVNVPGETAEQTALLLVARFSALLEKTGRFVAVDPQRVLDVAAPGGTAEAPGPLDVARRLQTSAVLSSRLVHDGKTRVLETAWTSGRTGATLVTARTPLVRAVFPPRFAWEQTPELERRYALDGPVRGLAVADVDGDQRPELVVGDDRTLTTYRWQDGTGLTPVEGGELRPSGLILSVDAADLNGSGRAQIVLVEYRSGGEVVRSTVFELTGGRLRTLYEARGRYLRVIPVGAEPWLVEQRIGESEPFDPMIRRLVWRDGSYRDAATIRVPPGLSVYGLALLRLTGSPEPDVVALTPEDRLGVWTAGGRRLWTSADAYGGAAVTFPFTPAKELRQQIQLGAELGRIFGRVVVLPGAPEGPEILVFENLLPVGGQLRSALPRLAPLAFTQGRIHRLRWRDGGFLRVWQSRPTEGYIADFAHGDLDGDGVPEVIVGVVPRGLTLDTVNPLARPKAQLVFYELP